MIFAVGTNDEAVRLSGHNPDFYKVAAFTISGLTAGIAAMVYLLRLNIGSPIRRTKKRTDSRVANPRNRICRKPASAAATRKPANRIGSLPASPKPNRLSDASNVPYPATSRARE